MYLLFESEKAVRGLLQDCTHDFSSGDYYFKISSRRMRAKEVWSYMCSLVDYCIQGIICPLFYFCPCCKRAKLRQGKFECLQLFLFKHNCSWANIRQEKLFVSVEGQKLHGAKRTYLLCYEYLFAGLFINLKSLELLIKRL